MRVEDVHKIAFYTFGLTTAPATFCWFMRRVLHPCINKFVVVFFDDSVVFSKTMEEHKKHLDKVIQLLRENQLFLNSKKSEFFKKEIQYVGHVVGIMVDPKKTSNIREWLTPKNIHELRSLLDV